MKELEVGVTSKVTKIVKLEAELVEQQQKGAAVDGMVEELEAHATSTGTKILELETDVVSKGEKIAKIAELRTKLAEQQQEPAAIGKVNKLQADVASKWAKVALEAGQQQYQAAAVDTETLLAQHWVASKAVGATSRAYS